MKRNNNEEDDLRFEEEPEVDSEESVVSGSKGKNALIPFILTGIIVFVIYYFFFSEDDKSKKTVVQKPEVSKQIETVKPPEVDNELPTPTIPTLPEPPALVAPTPPPAPVITQAQAPTPPPPPLPTKTQSSGVFTNKRDSSTVDSRKKSVIMMGNKAAASGTGATEAGKSASDSPYFTPSINTEVRTQATRVGDTGFLIVQGKIIDILLETAINTDLKAPVRALVSRDVYAESGKVILLPKGSRLIGEYNSDVKRGQTRVDIIWHRVIRPDGIDIKIDSPGIDQLGRAGSEGEVDNRYYELFGNAILMSSINIGAAMIADNLSGTTNSSSTSTTTGSNGTTTTQVYGSNTDQAIKQANEYLSQIGKSLAEDYMQIKPTITIDQGTRLKVFVNRDLIFPASVIGNVKMVE